MTEGVLIYLAGIITGGAAVAAFFIFKNRYVEPEKKEDKYDRYRNEHGLLTRRAAKG